MTARRPVRYGSTSRGGIAFCMSVPGWMAKDAWSTCCTRSPVVQTLMQFPESLTPRSASSTASADPLAHSSRLPAPEGRPPDPAAYSWTTSEPEGRGGAWTEERGTSDEGRRRLKGARRRAGDTVSVLSGGDPRFRDDDGSADPRAAAALAAFAAGEGSEHDALTMLACSRLLVPVVASVSEPAGLQAPLPGAASTAMALPTLVGRDGRRAPPAFTALDAR